MNRGMHATARPVFTAAAHKPASIAASQRPPEGPTAAPTNMPHRKPEKGARNTPAVRNVSWVCWDCTWATNMSVVAEFPPKEPAKA